MTQSFNNMLNLIGSLPTNKSEREENAYVRSVIHGLVLAGGGVSAGIGPVRPAADGGGWRRRSEKDRIRQHRHHQCAPDRAQGTGGGSDPARRRQGLGVRAARRPFFRERHNDIGGASWRVVGCQYG